MKRVLPAFLAVLVSLVLADCARRQDEPALREPDPSLVSGHTAGVVSRKSAVRVRFTTEIAPEGSVGAELAASPFSFSPRVRGRASWADPRTLEFRPDQDLEPGTEYTVTVRLDRLVETTGERARFSFRFMVMRQSFTIQLEGLTARDDTDLERQELSGVLKTADVADAEAVEKVLSASQHGELPVRWSHHEDRVTHRFTVENILREPDPVPVTLSWNGRPIGVNEKGSRAVEVPPLGEFRVTGVRPVQTAERYLEVAFSDPLDREQSLTGLIWIEELEGLRYMVRGNVVRVYSPQGWPEELAVNVEPGIRNAAGGVLEKGVKSTAVFRRMLPQVRIPGNGVVFPTSQGLTIPVETVNLNGIVVEALRIYEDNVVQFLQVNPLGGDQELRRVGKVVWKRELPIDWNPDRTNQWIRTGLDLSRLVSDNPRGMYRLRVYFRRDQVEYDCPQVTPEELESRFAVEYSLEAGEGSVWDSWEYDYDSYYEFYDNRENPCHPAYYRSFYDHHIVAARNILVSDIGLTARMGTDRRLVVAASDLKTARPLSGVELAVFDYQRREVGRAVTGKDGLARIAVEDEPFVLTASRDEQASYLKLDRGSALSVSHFDVGGTDTREGLKGFVYGDRGVWRPGDTLYVTFILYDPRGELPGDHPVQLTLLNPRGQVVERVTSTRSVGGFHHFPLRTDRDAPTGVWTARVAVGGAVFEKSLPVETVRPNRIKIDLDFGAGTLARGTVEGKLGASWLHGAPARELSADVAVSFSQAPTRFDTYPGYAFDDPARSFSAESRTLFRGRLGPDGTTRFRAELDAGGEPPGMLRAGFFTRVFEPGGAASIDRFTLPFHPYRRYVGISTPPGDPVRGMLLTDTEHRVDIVLVDREGNPVPRGRVRAELFQINWRWWWEKGEEELASYMNSQDIRPLDSSMVEIENGAGSWSFQVDHPSWGRYLVRVSDPEGGHAAGKIVYVDWPGWTGRDMADAPGGASVLAFTTDKPAYRVGDEAVLTIPTAREGRLLVSLEAGGRLLSTEWVEPRGEATTYRFEVTGEMAPNGYAHVSYVQPHLQAGNDMPIRMYGVVPVMVEDPSTRLEPVIGAADVLRPEEEAAVTVTEARGRPMVYTLAVVDEGLLSLTRFATPDPWSHFYSREANAVSTWDLYDQVAAAYGGLLEQLLAVGGGMDEGVEVGERRADRFPPLVRFLGPFQLEENGTGEHRVSIPRYVGAVRIMCVAGMGGSFGSASREALVRKPLMVLGSLPRVMSTGEAVQMPVSVFVLEEGLGEVDVGISAEGALRLEGERSRRVRMEGTGDTLVSFALAAGDEPGVARVTLTAAAGAERAVQTIELDVRVPSLPVVEVTRGTVPPGGSWDRQVELTGIPGTRRAILEASRVPPIDLARRLEFLTGYPHGCIEQTVSAVFTQLYLDRLVELGPERADRVQRNVERGIARIRSFQAPGGGFGSWPGGRTADAWSTSYAGHFLLEARDAGYAVDEDLLEQWREFQRRTAFSWTMGPEGSELQQAYRLYTLALAGDPQMGAMNRLREVRELPDVARWRLAAAYHLAGRAETARELTSGPLPDIPPYRELGGTYGSDLRDQAMILETLVVMGRSDRAQQLIERISRELAGERWLSTQTTGYALLALAKHAGLSGGGEQTAFTYSWNGRERRLSSAAPIVQADLPVDNQAPGGKQRPARIRIENTGAATLYTRVITEGTPPPGGETAARSGIALSVSYRSADGEPLEPDALVQGTDVVAEVSVTHTGSTGPYRELALTHLVPSGWEITGDRLEGAGVSRGSEFEYRDIRDDRIFTYFDLDPGETRTFRVMLNASYAGRFYLPLIKVEAMYDVGISARTAGRWVEVLAP